MREWENKKNKINERLRRTIDWGIIKDIILTEKELKKWE